MEHINADYYYGIEAEQFCFYRLPKLLITDKRFSCLSNDAKLLYGLMLDRMSLSMSNYWLDKENKVYIIYTAEQIMRDMNCSNNKCAKILAELDSKKGIGLIERHKRGLGKPDIIYVKNFITLKEKEPSRNSNQIDEKKEDKIFVENESMIDLEIQNVNVQRWEKRISGNEKNTSQKMGKTHTNNTNINKTDMNINNPIYQEEEKQLKGKLFENDEMDGIQPCQSISEAEKAERYMQIIRENIEYDIYMQDSDNQKAFDEIYNLMCDVVTAKCASIRIGGVYYPHELVKARFLKLNSQHILYVIHAMKNVQDKIHNIRSYLITALYNAPTTMKHYYTNAVNADYGVF